MPGVQDSRLLRLEHSVSEAELILKAIKDTLRKGQGVVSQESLPAGEVGATQREVRNPRTLFRARPLPRGRRSGNTFPGVTSPFYLRGKRGASRNLAVRSPLCRGARPRRTRRECSNTPRYNIPAGTNFRLLTD